jgi:hypothetical protein
LNSFENQQQFFYDFIEKNKDKYSVYKSDINNKTGIYADRGISGTLLHRENFEKMLFECGLDCHEYSYTVDTRTDIDDKSYTVEYKDYKIEYNEHSQNPKFTEIIVKSTSRFARNILVTEILRKLSAIGVFVTFLDINKSTRNPDDLIIIQFFQQFDEMFSRDLSKKLLLANRQSAENQILRSNHDIYGYKYISRRVTKEPNNRLEIIEEEAYVIRLMFRLYFGCFKVVDEQNPQPMDNCNFNCPSCTINKTLKLEDKPEEGLGFRKLLYVINSIYKFRTRKGKEFKQTTIKHIFENEKYAGYLNNRKFDHGTVFAKNNTPKIREDYNLVFRPDLVPPIISKELFDLCVDKKNKKAGDTLGRFIGVPTKYRGFIKCGACGEIYTHNISNDGKGYYCCKTKRQKNKDACNNINIFDWQIEQRMHELAAGELNTLITSENVEVIGLLVKEIEDKLDFIERNRDIEEVSILHDSIEKDKRALQRLITDRAMSDYPEMFDNAMSEITKRLKQTTDKYDKLTKKPKDYIDESIELFNTCREIITMSETMQKTYTEDDVRDIVECFVIYGEPVKIKGVWQPPNPTIEVLLKTTATAKRLTNKDINALTIKSVVFNLGIVGASELDDAKKYLQGLEEKLNNLKIIYDK